MGTPINITRTEIARLEQRMAECAGCIRAAHQADGNMSAEARTALLEGLEYAEECREKLCDCVARLTEQLRAEDP